MRVILENESQTERVLGPLVDMGCHYEGANQQFIAISVPPSVSLEAVASHLTDANLGWEYANPSYEELFPGAR